jgi:hypothetical protein
MSTSDNASEDKFLKKNINRQKGYVQRDDDREAAKARRSKDEDELAIERKCVEKEEAHWQKEEDDALDAQWERVIKIVNTAVTEKGNPHKLTTFKCEYCHQYVEQSTNHPEAC